VDEHRKFNIKDKSGKFKPNPKTVVPVNVLTVRFVKYAFDIADTTFKRMQRGGMAKPPRVAVNKGKSVLKDRDWAKSLNNPRNLYVKDGMAEFLHCDEGRDATLKEKADLRTKLKEKFKHVTQDILDCYEKKARDHDARFETASEGVVTLLQQTDQMSYRALERVCLNPYPILFACLATLIVTTKTITFSLGNRQLVFTHND
jgi:hypothetical protein